MTDYHPLGKGNRAMINKRDRMQKHNAKQSATRLKTEAQLLHGKINSHLKADGLHTAQFQRAEHHLAYAIAMLTNVEDALS